MANYAIPSWHYDNYDSGFVTDLPSDDALEALLPNIEDDITIKEHLSNQGVHADGDRHQSLPASEWNRIREPFTKLWYEDGLELKDVIKIMAERYNFHASVPMYKKQSADWGLSKIFTTKEKTQLGKLAERLIARNEELPTHDSTGRMIPWDRVRRQYGRDKIPLHYLPARFRGKIMPDSSRRLAHRTKGDTVPPTSGLDRSQTQRHIILQRQSPKSEEIQLIRHRQKSPCSGPIGAVNMIHTSSELRRMEKFLFHMDEWILWCQLNSVPLIDGATAMIVYQCTRASDCLRQGDRGSSTRLMSLACSVQHALQQPTVSLSGFIFSVWATLQDRAFGEHGLFVARFLVSCTQSILGPTNPLSVVCHVLLDEIEAAHPSSLDDSINQTIEMFQSHFRNQTNLLFKVLSKPECVTNAIEEIRLRHAGWYFIEPIITLFQYSNLFDWEASNYSGFTAQCV